MDDTQRFAYGLKFENAFLRERGKAFETLFARIMAHAFPGDFQPVRPYGPKGDLKCDGFRASDGTVFQCYAPDAMKLEPLLAKVAEDFAGALVHWTTKMQRWEFVHNDSRGLPAEAVRNLAALNTANPNVALAVCGEAELRLIALSLALHQLEDLFGAVPSGRVLEKLDFGALRPVLLAIQRQEPDAEPSLTAPSAAKLEHNALSQDAAGLLRQGRRREQLVEAFFAGWPDPDLGEEIAQAFRVRYQALKAVGLSPDDIFGELQAFAGGMTGEPARQGAVLAVLSYFFERCDIFEDAIRIDAI
ncbi:MAG: ABC-three component system protein [Sphingobium sp.]